MRFVLAILFFMFASGAAATQQTFSFHPRQSVYIVSVRGTLGDPSLSTLDLAAEKEIREGFKKRHTFEIAPSLSKADFVFLCITEYLDGNPYIFRNVLAVALK